MRRIIAIATCLVMVAMALPQQVLAKRVALVIGNSAYEHVAKLPNPVNDAAAISSVLKKLGFEVITGLDVKRQEMEARAHAFARESEGADVALFFYAGHGLQVNGDNYLAPIDAKLDSEADLDFQTVQLNKILRNMERKQRTNLVFLDACRDNPLARNLARSMGTRSTAIGRGLARIESGIGTLIAFATQPGNVALDGTGNNSPFTRALLKHIETPNLDVAQLMRRVRVDVIESTAHRQVPWSNSSLTGDFFFASNDGGKAPPPPPSIANAAQQAWSSVSNSSSAAVLRTFIGQFPDTVYADFARARLKELEDTAKARAGSETAKTGGTPPPPTAGKAEKKDRETKVAVGTFAKKPPDPPKPTSRTFSPGETFKDCDTCPSMVVVPSGSFMMGSKTFTKKRGDRDERPRHKVTIARPFAVGRFEVTHGEFMTFARETSHDRGYSCSTWENGVTQDRAGRSFENPGFATRDDYPVVCVTWGHAQAYLTWLSHKTGKTYRLLSEAEWEYSARAGTTTEYFFGNDLRQICKYANSADASQRESWRHRSCNDGSGSSVTPVGKYLPNAFGLHDVHGNVWEFVSDCFSADYKGAPTDGSPRTESSYGCNNGIHMARSGSWANPVTALRSAYRRMIGNDAVYNRGFRVARDLGPDEVR